MEKDSVIIPKGRYLVTCPTSISEDIQWIGIKKSPNNKVGRIQYKMLPNPIIPDLHCFRLETNLGAWSHCVNIGPYQVDCYSEIGVLFMIDLDKYPKAYNLLYSDVERGEGYDMIKIKKSLLNPSIIGVRIPCEQCGKKNGCDCTIARQAEKAIKDFEVNIDERGKPIVKVKLNMGDFHPEDVEELKNDIKSEFKDKYVDIIFEDVTSKV